ncbi:RusA family crossover junction endodeoxyribonuclease [Achromobacter xylosoxidans]|uniref:RusA family crossover junction endodeoxyribonuclease n=1 Tax=Alcaligenes xylosoxydans xylosoxydans TaxID=85698 RepID=UPI001EEC0641|nr:RusA family crossover junction endodeoxyribonuclease [Achromobacter xylosoxidans]
MKTSQNLMGTYDPTGDTLGSNARRGAFQDEPFPPSGELEHGMPIVPNAPGAVPAQAASADTLQCLDLDNDHSVVLDSLKGVVFQDDAWMREISARRAEQDEFGAQLVAVVASLAVEQPQTDLFGGNVLEKGNEG